MGASHDEDRVGEVPVVGKGRAAQKAIKKVSDGHLAREEVGTDETGQEVEREGCPFGGAGAIEVDNPQETLDDKKEGFSPGAMNGKKPRAEEGHKFIVADRARRGNRFVVGDGNRWG